MEKFLETIRFVRDWDEAEMTFTKDGITVSREWDNGDEIFGRPGSYSWFYKVKDEPYRFICEDKEIRTA